MSRNSKRLLSVLTAILLFFSNFNGILVKAAGNGDVIEDTTPPVLNSLSVDKQEAYPGDEVTVSLDVTDENSGVKAVSVTLYNEYLGAMSADALYNEETRKFDAKFSITEDTRPGNWTIEQIVVYDQNDNQLSYWGDELKSFGTTGFKVNNAGFSDETPPVVHSISVDKQEVNFGDEVTVSLDITDDLSEITDVFVRFKNEDYGYKEGEATYNQETKKFEVKLPISYTMETGKWRAYYVSVNDKRNNWTEYNEGGELDFTSSEFVVLDGERDDTPPEVNGVSVDKQEVKPGETVTLAIDATDDKSGIGNISVSYRGSNGGYLNQEAILNNDTKKYEAKLQIEDTTKPGTWSISYIQVNDKAYNYTDLYNGENADFSSGDFNVINENADITPPTVNGVTVDKTEAHPGDKVKVSLDVTDDKSGVESVYVDMEGTNGGYFSEEAILNTTTNKYEATFTIEETTRPGTWSISYISVGDKEGNYKSFDEEDLDLNPADFTVINENMDIIPPTLKSVTVDKKEAAPGEEVKVSVDASDDKSGVDQVYINLNGSRGGYLGKNAAYNEETKMYEATFLIDDTTKPGTWSISYINISDKAGNEIYPDGEEFDFSGSEFTVNNPNADITPPTVNSVTVDKTEAHPGDKVKVSLDVTDDKSGVDSVYVELRGTNGGYLSNDAVLNTTTNKYEATFTIEETTRPGNWSISSIEVGDKEGNYKSFEEEDIDLNPADFTVINENMDITPPTLKSVTVDKKEAAPGEKVKVSVEASDDKSGVEQVYIGLNGSKGGYLGIYAEYNADTKMYEATFPVTDTTKPGTWSVSYINVIDKAGNEYNQYGEEFDFSGSEFTVINSNADITPPTVNSVTVDKTEAHPGDKVKVSLDVTDDKSGVDSVYVELRGTNGGYLSNDAVLNTTTNKYEATFTIEETTRPGTWGISYITVGDKEGNYNSFEEEDLDLSPADFSVINESMDITPPTLKSVTVDKKEAAPGGEVKISVDAADDKSGVESVYIGLNGARGGNLGKAAVYNAETKMFEATFQITDTTKPGTWSISYINVTDKAGNEIYQDGEEFDFSGSEFTVINPNADMTPPTVNSVTVDKTEAHPGDKVKVSLDVTDDKSGVDSVYVELRGTNGGYFSKEAVLNSTTNKYEATITIKATTRPGTWSISSINISDKEENYKYYPNDEDDLDLSPAEFTVINENVDIAPPTLKSVTVDKTEAHPGEEVTVSFDASDDKTGIETISVNYQAGDRYLDEQEAVFNNATGKYEVKLIMNDSSRPGEWKIDSVYLSDKEGNNQRTYNGEDQDLSGGNFIVINENADITPPSLKGVTIDKKDVVVGDKVTVSIDVNDDKSGVDQVSVRYRNSNGYSWWEDAIYNESTKRYEAQLSIIETTRPGTWTLNKVYVSDKEGNSADYFDGDNDLDFSNANFSVTNDKVDILPPTLNGITVDKKDVKPGDVVTVSIDAQDNKSGIQYISVDYKLPKKASQGSIAKFNSLTGKYEAKITISGFAQAGTWKIEGIELEDVEGNSNYIFNNKVNGYPGSEAMDLSAGNFVVSNDNEDISPPEVRSISVNKGSFTPGEKAVIEIEASDSQSGIDTIYVGFKGSNGGYDNREAIYNETTHKYVVQIPIAKNTKQGTWSLDYLYVGDNQGNYQDLDDDEYDFSASNYSVVNDESDITPPAVTNVSIDKTEGKPGDVITVSLAVADDNSSVEEVSIDFVNQAIKNSWGEPEDFWKNAVYNDQTHKYEAKIQITDKMKPGTWNISYVYVSDSEGNWKDIRNGEDADFQTGKFTVINSKADITAPEYLGMTVDKKVVNLGEEITFSVDATDIQSGISDVYIGLDNGTMDVYEGVYNVKTKKYDIKIPINKYYQPGSWKVKFVAINDKDNNGIFLDGKAVDFSNTAFEIINKEYAAYQEYLATYISNITVDKKVAKPDEAVKISLNFKDISKITDVSIRYVGLNGKSFTRNAYLDEKTGTFEVKIPITQLFKPGVWNLEDIYVTEYNNETLSLSNHGKVDFSKGDFSVNNTRLDSLAPALPMVNEVTDQSVYVTGMVESNAKVIVKSGDKELGTAFANREGQFSVSIGVQKAGTQLAVFAVDSSENVSEGTVVTVKDVTPPVKPVVNEVTDKAKEVTGKTEAGALIVVQIGTSKYTANKPADANGNYTVTIPQQKAGTKVYVTATDIDKNTSPETVVTVVDKTAPIISTVNAVSDKSKEVSGLTEVGAIVTVTIGSVKYTAPKPADAKGNYKVTIPLQKAGVKLSVTAMDAAKNVSPAKIVTVLDKTAPGAPAVNTVTDKSKEVSGKTEAGAIVTVAIGSKKYTSKPADTKGYYKVSIPLQKAGVKLLVTAKDKAGNVSTTKTVVVYDKTPPSAPTVKTSVKSTTKEVTGTAEAYATITIKVGSKVIGTGTADKKGNYKVKIKAQKKKTVLSVTATDKAKNVSKATTIKVK